MIKECTKCGDIKSVGQFYKHPQTSDGYDTKCKVCAKKAVSLREAELRKDPEWVKKERERGREKYHRLGLKKPNKEQKTKTMKAYRMRYPEKYSARIKSQRLAPVTPGNHLHHWSYAKKNAMDVIEITPKDHATVHRFLVYDQERKAYRRADNNILLDSREAHEEFIQECLK